MDPINIPLNFSSRGPVATDPNTLRDVLIQTVAANNPGYTVLPSGLIEDISSTDTAALAMIDLARVDAVNQISPYTANPYMQAQQGLLYGIPQGTQSNGSAFVIFNGPVGFIINPGFLVSDGTNNFRIIDGGVIASGGASNPLLAVATVYAIFPIPENTINQLATSVPSTIVLTVNNPNAGTPAAAPESPEAYRARNLQAAQVGGQGTPQYIKTLINRQPGTQPRLVSIVQAIGGWKILVGGSADPYLVAGAIYRGILDLTTIVGSTELTRNIETTVFDVPDSYLITYVAPFVQTVDVTVRWNTTLPRFFAGAQVNQLASPALQSYINSITVSQPINLLDLTNVFQEAVSPVLAPQYVTTLIFEVKINGTIITPPAGTSIIPSDSEGYFFTTNENIRVEQG